MNNNPKPIFLIRYPTPQMTAHQQVEHPDIGLDDYHAIYVYDDTISRVECEAFYPTDFDEKEVLKVLAELKGKILKATINPQS